MNITRTDHNQKMEADSEKEERQHRKIGFDKDSPRKTGKTKEYMKKRYNKGSKSR